MNRFWSIDAYQRWTDKTAAYPHAGSGHSLTLYYVAMGLSSEAGEVAGKIKKLLRDDTFNKEDIVAELGDVLWYCARLAKELDINLTEVLSKNVEKLEGRLTRDTIKGSGDNR